MISGVSLWLNSLRSIFVTSWSQEYLCDLMVSGVSLWFNSLRSIFVTSWSQEHLCDFMISGVSLCPSVCAGSVKPVGRRWTRTRTCRSGSALVTASGCATLSWPWRRFLPVSCRVTPWKHAKTPWWGQHTHIHVRWGGHATARLCPLFYIYFSLPDSARF